MTGGLVCLLLAFAPPWGARGLAAEPAAPSGPMSFLGEVESTGGLHARVSEAPADLVVYYAGEQRGSMETCGCPHRPRGSLARLKRYVDASRAAAPSTPGVLVNPGDWLQEAVDFDGVVHADLALSNAWMARGVLATGYDALHVTPRDLAGLLTLPEGDRAALPLVSASIAGPGIAPFLLIERGGLRVGVTGISAEEPTLTDTPGYTRPSAAAVEGVIRTLTEQADVVVLLSWHAAATARGYASVIPRLDVVLDADRHREEQDPFQVGGAVWALSDEGGLRVGELRLGLADGRVTDALDRHIDLDEAIPDDRAVLRVQQQGRAAVDALGATGP